LLIGSNWSGYNYVSTGVDFVRADDAADHPAQIRQEWFIDIAQDMQFHEFKVALRILDDSYQWEIKFGFKGATAITVQKGDNPAAKMTGIPDCNTMNDQYS
jgi:hypothetical protein